MKKILTTLLIAALAVTANAQDVRVEANTVNAVNANWPFKFGGPYYSHIFIDKIDADSDVVIPCQSVFDVQIAARLGFRFIEANVHKTATPGKYIVMHGVRGKLGGQVMRLDGSSAEDVVIAETSFEDLMSNFVYRSKYAKYRTHITSLEEFLTECRRNNIAPMIQHVDEQEVEIIKSYMGNNFIMYWGYREEFSGPILEYWGYKTAEEILNRCRFMGDGAPYMYCMGNTRDFTDEQLSDICREVHKLGCYIGFAGTYEDRARSEKMLALGMDFSASGCEINEIASGNLCNLAADLSFDDFKTKGKVVDHVLKLSEGQTLRPGVKLGREFLSGGSLHIMFRGKIKVDMGDYIHTEFVSDGSRSTWISSYFLDQAPTFTITATEPTEILTMTYKASKM
jgi:hypothetical protein